MCEEDLPPLADIFKFIAVELEDAFECGRSNKNELISKVYKNIKAQEDIWFLIML